MTPTAYRAFTLIEISLVLVIIGLLIGGVITGKTLIDAAQIRKTVSQKDQIDTAVNTFRLKYGCLPGDCVNATGLGFSGGDNDGNEIIFRHGNNDYTRDKDAQYWFWRHLNEAGVLEIKPQKNSPYQVAGIVTPDCPICNRVAAPDIGDIAGMTSGGWFVSDVEAIEAAACGFSDPFSPNYPTPTYRALFLTTLNLQGYYEPAVKHAHARSIDAKIDDGKPNTGTVVAVDRNYYSNAGCSGLGSVNYTGLNRISWCYDSNNSYHVSPGCPSEDDFSYDLMIKAGF